MATENPPRGEEDALQRQIRIDFEAQKALLAESLPTGGEDTASVEVPALEYEPAAPEQSQVIQVQEAHREPTALEVALAKAKKKSPEKAQALQANADAVTQGKGIESFLADASLRRAREAFVRIENRRAESGVELDKVLDSFTAASGALKKIRVLCEKFAAETDPTERVTMSEKIRKLEESLNGGKIENNFNKAVRAITGEADPAELEKGGRGRKSGMTGKEMIAAKEEFGDLVVDVLHRLPVGEKPKSEAELAADTLMSSGPDTGPGEPVLPTGSPEEQEKILGMLHSIADTPVQKTEDISAHDPMLRVEPTIADRDFHLHADRVQEIAEADVRAEKRGLFSKFMSGASSMLHASEKSTVVPEAGKEKLSFKERMQNLKERTKEIDASLAEKSEKFVKNIGEKYNKLPTKYKIMLGASLAIGAGISIPLSVPLTSIFGGLIATQRAYGMAGMFVKFEKHLQETGEGIASKGKIGKFFANREWYKKLSDKPEQNRQATAAIMAMAYTFGMSAVIGGAVRELAQTETGKVTFEYWRDFFHKYNPSFGKGGAVAVATEGQLAHKAPGFAWNEVPKPTSLDRGVPSTSATSFKPVALNAAPVEAPAHVSESVSKWGFGVPRPAVVAEAVHAPATIAGPSAIEVPVAPAPESISKLASEVHQPVAAPAAVEIPKVPAATGAIAAAETFKTPDVLAEKGQGYERMVRHMWKSLQEAKGHLDVSKYPEGSDIRVLLEETDESKISELAHNIAADEKHGFYNPDGSSVAIDLNSHMTIGDDGQMHIADAKHTDMVHAAEDMRKIPAHDSSVPVETHIPKPAELPVTGPEQVAAKIDIPEAPMHVETESVPTSPSVFEHTKPFINSHNLSIDPTKAGVYQDPKGEVFAYGTTFSERWAAGQEYAKEHPMKSVWVQAEKPTLYKGVEAPWVQKLVFNKGLFGEGHIEVLNPKGPTASWQVGAVNPDTFVRAASEQTVTGEAPATVTDTSPIEIKTLEPIKTIDLTDEQKIADEKISATHPNISEQAHSMVNSFGVEVDASEPHIYSDGEKRVFVYGGSVEDQAKEIGEYLKRNPESTIFGTDITGKTRLPWHLVDGEPMVGTPVQTKGIFGSGFLQTWMKAPSPEEFEKIIK